MILLFLEFFGLSFCLNLIKIYCLNKKKRFSLLFCAIIEKKSKENNNWFELFKIRIFMTKYK